MRISKYLIGVWAAVVVYSLFSFLAGPKGMSAYQYLLSERDRQWDNIKELGILNEELEITRNNLIYDDDTLLVHARKLGYGTEDERFIRIVGLSMNNSAPPAPGTKYLAQKPDFIADRYIKITAVVVGLVLFAFLMMLEIIDRRSR